MNHAPDKAIVDFKTAIEKQPNNPIGYTALADLYLTQKNTNAALQVIQSGLKLLPDNVVLHMSLASIMEQGKIMMARSRSTNTCWPSSRAYSSQRITWQACSPTTAPIRPVLTMRKRLRQACERLRCHSSRIQLAGSNIARVITRLPVRFSKKRQPRYQMWR